MAKAAEIPPEIADSQPQEWLAEVLRIRFEEVLQFLDAALEPSGVDAVHDIRVAIRRLRSVLRDFASVVDKRPLAELTKALKKLAGAFGRVRDLDVMIEELEALGKQDDGKNGEGIRLIIDELKEKRASESRSLENSVTGEFVLELRGRFTASVESALRQRRLFEDANVRDEGSRTIEKCLDEFLKLSDAFYRPFSTKRLHRLRIAGKHLRYAIELFTPQFGDALKSFADGMKKMQSHLGEIHDCDVWVERMRLIAKRKGKNSASDKLKHSAALWLLSQFVSRRTTAYSDALSLWSEWESEVFVKMLRDVVSAKADAAQ
jgi:CHAD domain-containing protein